MDVKKVETAFSTPKDDLGKYACWKRMDFSFHYTHTRKTWEDRLTYSAYLTGHGTSVRTRTHRILRDELNDEEKLAILYEMVADMRQLVNEGAIVKCTEGFAYNSVTHTWRLRYKKDEHELHRPLARHAANDVLCKKIDATTDLKLIHVQSYERYRGTGPETCVELFFALLRKLAQLYMETRGFWANRERLLQHIEQLYVLARVEYYPHKLDGDRYWYGVKDLLGFALVDDYGKIHLFEVFETRKKLGSALFALLYREGFDLHPGTPFVNDSDAFWRKMCYPELPGLPAVARATLRKRKRARVYTVNKRRKPNKSALESIFRK